MATDPYKYFRIEARELIDGLSQGVLELEKGAPADAQVARLLRLGHTLKGAARVVRQPEIAELAHEVEELLSAHRGAAEALPRGQASALLELLDRAGELLRLLDPAAPAEAPSGAEVPADDTLETLRVAIAEMDALLRGVTEAAVQVRAMRAELGTSRRLQGLAGLVSDRLAARPGRDDAQAAREAAKARPLADELGEELELFNRSLAGAIERAEARLSEVEELTHRLRLVPAHTVFAALERSARDAAEAIGVEVDFQTDGGAVRLDAQVLSSLRDALMHVVRNAVAHGIEPRAARLAVGKPARGQVWLSVRRRGGRVSFVCRDDGRGVDLAAVREAALARGMLSAAAAAALDLDGALALLRTGGLSTSGRVTELSGRGIGLDVVRATVAGVKGELDLGSEPGAGTTVTLHVPVSIASMNALLLEEGGLTAAIPLEAVRRTLRLPDADVTRSARGETARVDEGELPFITLHRALGASNPAPRGRQVWSAAVIHLGGRSVVLGAGRLPGAASVVMWALPSAVRAEPVVAGASLDAHGDPLLVLDAAGLIQAAEGAAGREPVAARAPRALVLVIDDSLTTRRLEQSILESAGYDVEVAESAEEGLTRARARVGTRAHSLFLVDVEMPGMDGFGFVREVRRDPALHAIPAILVTSRDAPEDRRQGEESGANAYIVKGEFDQNLLLDTIRRLVG
ncbi:MAG: response regulator [Deltaproteobacteria bacterium]|nr:response regulator [Deltaproteobacteria bacterium]MCB9785622.1 response regulator [Deltaproteobacteria bacterium]